MNLADIEAFIAVAEAGSVNRAALRLGLTQPAVTRRLQRFEALMGGAALLDRSAKPSVLTAAGREALDYCRRVLKAVAELKAAAGPAGPPSGEFRIGIPHSLAEAVLAAPIEALRRRFPGLRLTVSTDWSARLAEKVRNGALDCAVALTADRHETPSDIIATPIGAERIAVVAARAFLPLRVRQKGLRLRDLAAEAWVLNPAPCGYRAALQRAFDREKMVMTVFAEVMGYDLQRSLIARGVGLGLVPERHLAAGSYRRLQCLKVSDFVLEGRIAMLQGAAPTRRAVAIADLQERIAAALSLDII